MVVNIDSSRFSTERSASSTRVLRRAANWPRTDRADRPITIGLLNNMAGAAFKATERQFVALLDSASEGLPIHVSFYTMPGMSQTDAGGHHFAGHYTSVEALWGTHLDGLIVTGREPKMQDLRDEPYWHNFTKVLEWARTNTYSTVWSCLAAHAAILHMDGISRRKSADKHFGVFECSQESEHALMRGLPLRYAVPHSRWNGVAQKDLLECGYKVLSRIRGDGVDTFIKQEDSLFVFFQGHLEYEADTLLREYRRDVGRYATGVAGSYPLLPEGYFDSITEKELISLRNRSKMDASADLLSTLKATLETTKLTGPWRGSAARIYRNWLECICARKQAHKSGLRIGASIALAR